MLPCREGVVLSKAKGVRCTVAGCKGWMAVNSSDKYCYFHLKKYEPETIRRIKNERKVISGTPNFKGEISEFFNRKSFDLGYEKEVEIKTGHFSEFKPDDMVGSNLLRKKMFAMWLEADDISRKPQDIRGVAEILECSIVTLTRWGNTLEVRKLRADILDDVMRYDVKKIALEAFANAIHEGEAKALDRYMQIYVDKTLRTKEENDGISEWMKKKLKNLPEDATTDRKNKGVVGPHADLEMKAMREE